MFFFFFFFFFQAEDGIRDLTVTGVQTCALPILSPQVPQGGSTGTRQKKTLRKRPVRTLEKGAGQEGRYSNLSESEKRWVRSEERRVGKECRCRWWPYH